MPSNGKKGKGVVKEGEKLDLDRIIAIMAGNPDCEEQRLALCRKRDAEAAAAVPPKSRDSLLREALTTKGRLERECNHAYRMVRENADKGKRLRETYLAKETERLQVAATVEKLQRENAEGKQAEDPFVRKPPDLSGFSAQEATAATGQFAELQTRWQAAVVVMRTLQKTSRRVLCLMLSGGSSRGCGEGACATSC